MKPRCRIPLIDVGVDLQRFWRKFSPDPFHVPDWGEPPCRARPSGRPGQILVQTTLSEGQGSLAPRDLDRALCLECVSGGR